VFPVLAPHDHLHINQIRLFEGVLVESAARPVGTNCARAGLPVVPVRDLIERSTVRSAERAEWPANRVAQADHVHRRVAVKELQDPLRLLLVGDGRMARADAQVSGGQHHERGRLPEVIQQPVVVPLVVRFVGHQHGRRRRASDVPAAPSQVLASSASCSRPVTTSKCQGCQFCEDGARRPASQRRSRSSAAMGWPVYWRTLRRARVASQVSMAQFLAPEPVLAAGPALAHPRSDIGLARWALSRFRAKENFGTYLAQTGAGSRPQPVGAGRLGEAWISLSPVGRGCAAAQTCRSQGR